MRETVGRVVESRAARVQGGARGAARRLALLVAALGVFAMEARAQSSGIPVGTQAPGAEVETLDGKPADLGAYVGDTPVVIEFWATIMEDHAEFIAHLLDPQEKVLIAASRKSAELFGKLRNTSDGKAKALAEGQAMVAFKTTATKGIEEGKIKSIIHPTLADHVRREAVKFVDELRRT